MLNIWSPNSLSCSYCLLKLLWRKVQSYNPTKYSIKHSIIFIVRRHFGNTLEALYLKKALDFWGVIVHNMNSTKEGCCYPSFPPVSKGRQRVTCPLKRRVAMVYYSDLIQLGILLTNVCTLYYLIHNNKNEKWPLLLSGRQRSFLWLGEGWWIVSNPLLAIVYSFVTRLSIKYVRQCMILL